MIFYSGSNRRDNFRNRNPCRHQISAAADSRPFLDQSENILTRPETWRWCPKVAIPFSFPHAPSGYAFCVSCFHTLAKLPNLQFLCFDNDTTMGGLRAPGRRAIRWNARHKKPLPSVQWNARVGGTACLPQRMG